MADRDDTPLDREAVKHYEKLFPIRIAPEPPFPSEGYCANVFGEYILECIFPKSVAAQFQLLFYGTRAKQEGSLAILKELSGMKAHYAMKFWRNAELSGEIRSKIRGYF